MKKKDLMFKFKKIVSTILVCIILFSSFPFYAFSIEDSSVKNTVDTENVLNEESEKSQNNQNNISVNNLNQGEKSEENGKNQKTTQRETIDEHKDNSLSQDNLVSNSITNTLRGANSLNATSTNVEEGFKVNLRWSGTTNTDYTWNAEEQENRIIKLTFYYQNEVTSKDYAQGDLKVTIPGIGKLNRNETLKATDVAADEYGVATFTRDWSYKYDKSIDTYTFFNNSAIERGESFSGSFELLWEFESRECVNGFSKTLQATLNDGQKSVLSQELTLNYTSKKDEFYIEKTATGVVSADGLNNFVEEGKQVSDYAWVRYNIRYGLDDLNARGLKTRTFIDRFPSGCVIASRSNVIKNSDETLSYIITENSVSDYGSNRFAIIVGYPKEQYLGTTVKNTAYIYGVYKDEEETELLGKSEVEVELINVDFNFNGYVISTNKNIYPYTIYRNSLNDNIDFRTTLSASTNVKPIEQEEYGIALTDDLLEIYTDDFHRLTDDEYRFTSVTVPGKNKFKNVNGFELESENCTVKIKVLYKENVNTRNLNEYTTVYEGEWNNQEIVENLDGDVVAVRVELDGLTESLNDFYIRAYGKINVSQSNYEDASYIINYSFTDFYDDSGAYLSEEITQENYSREDLYNKDVAIYGKGLQRAYDTIIIKESEPGTYYANAKIDDFTVDKEIENFKTTQKHETRVDNTNKKPISKIEVYGVQEKEELKTSIETLKFTYYNLKFKYKLSDDITENDENMQDYLRERATIEKNGKEIKVVFNFEDNPIVSNDFRIGYSVDSYLKYEDYYEETNPYYTVTTYASIEGEDPEPGNTSSYQNRTMAYGTHTNNILLALASHQQLIKLIKTEYTKGEFVEDGAVLPLNTEYTYRLKLRNGYNTLEDTEFIDILEHSELTKVDEEYPYNESEWYGKLKNVNTKYLENKGKTVKVYYANTINLENVSWTLMETHQDGIWQTPNNVKAIKVEIDGAIEENSIIHVDVNMQAPADRTMVDKLAYNTYSVTADAIDVYTGLRSSYMRNMPSNCTEVRLIEKEYSVEITKQDEESGNKLPEVTFGIYNGEGEKINTVVTNILGKATIKELKEGTYILKEEVVPQGYEQQEDYTLSIENGNYTLKQNDIVIAEGESILEGTVPTIRITIENKRAKGSITVHKIDEYLNERKEEIPLEGIEFELQDIDGNILNTGTTNEDGEILFENLPWGKTYVVKEINTLNAYILAQEQNTYLSRLVKDKTVTVKNERKEGSVRLTKEDEKDGTIKLQGAEYGLYAKNDIYDKTGEVKFEKDKLIKYKTTDEQGQVYFEDLIWGDYYIKEIKSIYGYELSDVKHEFTINAETVETTIEKTEKEERCKAKLELIKIDDKGNFLKDAEFTLFDENGERVQKDIVTNENGQLIIENIEWGTYYIQEVRAPQGYENNDTKYYFTVNRETFQNNNKVIATVRNNTTNEDVSIIRNNKKKGKATLTKYKCNASGEETDEPLEGAVFELYLADGTKVGNDYTSNGEGKIIAENLDWGSYYFQEKEAPSGYSVSNKKISFVINSKNVDFEQNLVAYNKLETGEIKINKKIKANSIVPAHGNVSFIFKIVGKEGEEEKVTLYRTVTFTKDDEPDNDGNITKTVIISDIERYKYEITEEQNYRYELDNILPVSTNSSVNGTIGIIDLAPVNKGEITFVNKKTSNSLLTDSNLNTNSTQSDYYLIGLGVTPKESEYVLGTELTADDFIYTLYYSGSQEEIIEIPQNVTLDGESTYTQLEEGYYIVNIEAIVDGKTFEAEATTKWGIPNDYFSYSIINEQEKTIRITGVNSQYPSPSVLYIPSEYNGYNVYEIGTNSYNWRFMEEKLRNIDNVKNVIIEDGVKIIRANAFGWLSNLTSIEMPDSVTEIRPWAFYSCSNLVNVSMGNGVTSIGHNAFEGCIKLTSIVIPGNNTTIAGGAFSYCRGLINLEIKEGVTKIEGNAFSSCNGLTSVEIPSSVTSIANYAFAYCTGLTSVDIKGNEASIGNNAFAGCDNLTDVTLEEGVASIGNNAFSNCSGLTEIEIPGSVTNIEKRAFAYCSNLTDINVSDNNQVYSSVDGVVFNKEKTEIILYPYARTEETYVIPSYVTSIGSSAFLGCNNLTSVTIGEGVTSIGSLAFSQCDGLTEMQIPSSVTSIEKDAFDHCNNLTSINVSENNETYSSINGVVFNKEKTKIIIYPYGRTGEYVIPNGVTSISDEAFYKNSNLTSIVIPGSVTNIGSSAFSRCNNLTSVTIEEGVTSIGTSAFTNCGSLTEIEIPGSVTSIGNSVFSNCYNLASVTIEEGVTSIGTSAFAHCSSLTEIAIPGSVTSIGDSAFSSCYNLTNVTIDEGVTNIDSSAFAYCSSLTEVEIPGSVTSIGHEAFYGCRNLTEIEIPGSVTSIGYSAFTNCSSLTEIEIPGSVTSIGDSAFSSCSNLASVTIGEGVTSIGSSAFTNCSSLAEIEIPGSVTSIGDSAFSSCINLASVTIEEGVTSIGYTAFSNCSSLTEIEIPGSVTSIRDSAFSRCSNLTSVTIGEGVTNIGYTAFYGCSNLTEIEIPRSVSSIGYTAFSECTGLVCINVDSNNENYRSIDGVLFNKEMSSIIKYPACKTDETYSIPMGVTSIDSSAFEFCRSLTEVEIPGSVTNINPYAFENCSSLISVCIPNGVAKIRNGIFSRCTNLTTIDVPNSITNIEMFAFYGCDRLTTINYHGTEEEFNAIVIEHDNNPFQNATVNYITD